MLVLVIAFLLLSLPLGVLLLPFGIWFLAPIVIFAIAGIGTTEVEEWEHAPSHGGDHRALQNT